MCDRAAPSSVTSRCSRRRRPWSSSPATCSSGEARSGACGECAVCCPVCCLHCVPASVLDHAASPPSLAFCFCSASFAAMACSLTCSLCVVRRMLEHCVKNVRMGTGPAFLRSTIGTHHSVPGSKSLHLLCALFSCDCGLCARVRCLCSCCRRRAHQLHVPQRAKHSRQSELVGLVRLRVDYGFMVCVWSAQEHEYETGTFWVDPS